MAAREGGATGGGGLNSLTDGKGESEGEKVAQQASAASKYLLELIAKFPDAPALTLAKTAYREHPEYWRDVEGCRSRIRYYLGVSGKANKGYRKDSRFVREPRKAGWSDVIPEALVQLPDWQALAIAGPHRALILSDIHIPFHDPEALEVALEYGSKQKPTLIILNGDICDHFALSRWETDPKMRDFPGEVRSTRQFLGGMRKRFPKARLVYHFGNHEERMEKYLRLKAPELLGLPDLEWSSIFGLEEFRIELVKDKRPIRLNELNVLHGHEYVFSISNPVNPARGLFLRCKTHAIGGHFHQHSSHSEANLDGKVISTWSTGCLCDRRPIYRPLNNWSAGAACVTLGKDTGFQVENFRVVNGKVW